jgi:two-component system response regulator LytT
MNIVIVEDEPLVQQRIQRLTLEILAAKQPKIICFSNLDNAEVYLAENSIDLLLLDLNLMGRNGFDLLKNSLASAYHTIVISAYADKAIEAFEYGVLDFVAKPFTTERLAKALERLLESAQRSYYGCRYLSIKKTGGIELLAIADISYIQAEGHYSLIHLNNEVNSTALHAKNIEKIMQLLPENFLRVHRSYIANINLVKKLVIEEGSRYSIQLATGQKIPVGRTKYQDVKQYLALKTL